MSYRASVRRGVRAGGARFAGALVACALGVALLSHAALGGDGRHVPGAPRTRKDMAVVELGRRLFFDPAVSRSGVRSCGSCHDPEHGFSDPSRFSADDFGRTRRHSQTLLDAADNPTAHWDGEFESVEELVVARLGVPSGRTRGGYGQPTPPSESAPPTEDDDEEEASEPEGPPAPTTPPSGVLVSGHGAPVPEAFDVRRLVPVAERLEEWGRYAEAFQEAFGSPSVTTARLAEAIAAYVDSIRSSEAPFDRHVRGDRAAMSAAAVRGLSLFRTQGCALCHSLEGPSRGGRAGDGTRAALTDFEFHNTGVAFHRVEPGTDPEALAAKIQGLDGGRGRIDTAPGHRRQFKTPTLRDVARRGPYMHDGSLARLEDVVRYYARGGAPDPLLDPNVRPFVASEEDVADLVAFLRALTGEVRPGLAPTLWDARAERTRVQIVDGAGRPMKALAVVVAPSGDTLPGDLPRTSPTLRLRTDRDGWIEYVPPFRTHARLDLEGGLEAEGGTLVPDTCRRAVLRVPVDGKVALVVAFASDRPPPERLVAEHETEMAMPAPMVPRTTLLLESEVSAGGRRVARYAGWFRTDQSPVVRLRLPGDRSAAVVRRVALAKNETIEYRVEDRP